MDFTGFFHAAGQLFIDLFGPDTASEGTTTNPPTPPPSDDDDGSFSMAFSSAFE